MNLRKKLCGTLCCLVVNESEVQSHIYTHLYRLATLLKSASHRFEVERGVVVVRQVASPEIDLYRFGFERDITVQGCIEILRNMIRFRPINLSRTGDIRSEGGFVPIRR